MMAIKKSRKRPKVVRNEIVHMRLTEAEYARIDDAAAELEKPIGAFCREIVLTALAKGLRPTNDLKKFVIE